MPRRTNSDEELLCSFCGKWQRQVDRLIAGPGVYICDECVAVCNDILDERPPTAPSLFIEELPKPREIYRVLDQYVVGQDQAQADPVGGGL